MDSQCSSALPNILEQFDSLIPILQGRNIALFLDYDGTLTPIVKDPSSAYLNYNVKRLLLELSRHLNVGIVTGRRNETIQKLTGITPETYLKLNFATSHGFQIYTASETVSHSVGGQHLENLQRAGSIIFQQLKYLEGFELENNKYTITFHYRNVADGNLGDIEACIDSVIEQFPMLRKSYGKMVIELKINVDWNKGAAVEWIMEYLELLSIQDNVVTFYIGDDLTDEDAFRFVNKLKNGITVIVTDEPRVTNATWRIQDPQQVEMLLQKILDFVILSASGRATSSID